MNFADRIKKSFGIFGRDDPNAKYGVYKILDDKSTLVSSGTKESCEDQKNKLMTTEVRKIPKYVVRKLSNLWSFSSSDIDTDSVDCYSILNSLQNIIHTSKNKKLVSYCTKMFQDFDRYCKSINLFNFSEEFDSSEVETKWAPPENLFAEGSADEIAKEVHKSHDSLKSAMACLNFYLNRGGDNIPDDRKKVIEDAKEKIRGMYDKNFSAFDQLDLLMNGKGINVVKVERVPPTLSDSIISIPYWRYYFYLNDTFALGFYFKDGKWNCNTRVPDTKCPEKAEILKVLTEKYPNGIAENKNFSLKYKKIVLNIIDQDGEIMKMLEFISTNSLAGHSFDVVVDPGSNDNERTFFIDGDGSDKLKILE